ncbi:MAG: winged helix-turn-helix domain-containing protein [Thermoplasmataceae archaeon]
MTDAVASCEIKNLESVDTGKFEGISRFLNLLGNRTRVAILAVISKYGEVCACELQPALGLPQPTITTHLRKMFDAGLLKQRETWKYSYYFINPRYAGLIDDIMRNQESFEDRR